MLKNILSGLSWVASYSIAQLFTNLLLTFTLARILAPADFGIFAIALAIVSFMQIFAQLGISAATIQIDVSDKDFFATAFSIVLVFSVVLMLLGTLIITLCLELGFETELFSCDRLSVLRTLIFVLPFLTLGDFFQSLYVRDLTFRTPAVISFLSFLLGNASVSLALAVLDYGVFALVYGYLAQYFLFSTLLFIRLKNRPKLAFKIVYARRMLHYGVGFSIAKIANSIALQADKIIVASYLGNATLGLYSRSYQIIMSPISIVVTIVDKVLFPAMSRKKKHMGTIRNAFLMLNGGIFAFFVPLSLLLFEFSNEIVLALLGSKWSEASVPFGFLALGLSFRAGYRVSDIIARALGYVYRRALVQWVYAGCIIIAVVLGVSWGLVGVVIGVSLVIALNWVLMTWLTVKLVDISTISLLASFRPALFTSSLILLAVFAVNQFLDRSAQLSPLSTASTAYVIAPLVIIPLTLQSSLAAITDWINILRRARGDD